MKTKLLILAAILLVLAGSFACEKNESEVQVKEFIIGKWQVIAQGQTEEDIKPITPDNSYTEYFKDGTIGYFNTEVYAKYTDRIYKMDDACLYVIFGTDSDQIYEYYYNNFMDLLTLKIIKGDIPAIYPYPFIKIYQRIK
ncbi:hypothetical protein AGMMS50262_02980 [Bacteroidia bacterium]|nr:hypothetical protein AGMMS50262_02980 [Bacteroidia bacterium]